MKIYTIKNDSKNPATPEIFYRLKDATERLATIKFVCGRHGYCSKGTPTKFTFTYEGVQGEGRLKAYYWIERNEI